MGLEVLKKAAFVEEDLKKLILKLGVRESLHFVNLLHFVLHFSLYY